MLILFDIPLFNVQAYLDAIFNISLDHLSDTIPSNTTLVRIEWINESCPTNSGWTKNHHSMIDHFEGICTYAVTHYMNLFK